MKGRGTFGVLAALAGVVVLAAAFTTAAQGVHATSAKKHTAAVAGCQLGDKGNIKHVIYIQFDNVHFLRDNPNVPSDVEQMPNLLNFIRNNGTLDTNDHTILISHTGGGILSTLTGLYPDRHGQAVSNSYGFFRPDNSVGFSSSFKYWTDQTDAVTDPNYNMVNADTVDLGGSGAVRNTPAPWVPFARAGCDVGNVGVANTVLENTATDATGDMTKVFGTGSPEWNEAAASNAAPSGTAARALAQTDFVGIAIHCAAGGGICNANSANARPDPLPDEAAPGGGAGGGYTGFKALFGAKYVNPAINHGSASISDTNGQSVADPFGQPGFPGFDGMYAKNTLGYVAQMQESGVPVTFAYISDAHDNHGNSGNIHIAYGPGEAGYVQQLRDYDKAFGDFFTRLKNDGITKDNSLFVVTVEEGDHFGGTKPDAPCDGVTTPCTYNNGHVTEVNGDLKRLVATYNASHGTSATTNFSVHSDMAPNVYIVGKPARDSATARTLEKAMSDMDVKNPLSGVKENLFVAMADPVEQKLLHMVTADPARTPTFTPFARGDYFLNASSTSTCPNNDLDNCVFIPGPGNPPNFNPNQTFAWNHGGVQPEVRTTWLGMVGPGIEHKAKLDDDFWSDHTDVRPTMLALLGLKDSYVSDGRVLTDILKGDALPKSLNAHHETVERLGRAYKQIMASFGQFSMDTLDASTGALASDTPGDGVYSDTETQLANLGAERDTLAGKIRLALWNAEFNNQKLDEKQAKDWIDQANDLLNRAAALAASFQSSSNQKQLKKINHVVVIYEENHSFDNLYGGWEGVNGLSHADPAHTTQYNEAGHAYNCLKQNDANLQAPSPLTATCTDATAGTPGGPFVSHFPNTWFTIDDYIKPSDTTCPQNPLLGFSSPGGNGWLKGTGAPGGCTRDIVHRFYHEQYQLDGGEQDRYVTGSDAMGLTMGVYDTTALPIYDYLHSKGHPKYAIDDNFFQAAFGGSFLNHQWLIAAATPVDPTGAPGGGNANRHPVLDDNGMPSNEPLYASTLGATPPPDRELTATCAQVALLPAPINTRACGNYGVNTMQPVFYPSGTFGALLPAQSAPTIGDRLNGAGIDWAWYAGGWANASGDTTSPYYTNGSAPSATPTGCSDPYVDPNSRGGVPAAHWPRCPSNLFQYHHQPFNYFTAFSTETADGRANRAAHLRDEGEFMNLANSSDGDCNLKAVSFVKPFGTENEHPGYASEPNGSDHLVSLLKSIESSKCAKDTMVIVTYDEFGGEWDHVSPPGQGNNNGPHDVWGPGTRVPTLIIAPHLKHRFVVDSTEHDTTSILTTIEHRWGLDPLGTRDAAVADLSSVFSAKKPKGVHHH
jgi:acid phosphatase